jgi:plasmid stabilization system protein ParE
MQKTHDALVKLARFCANQARTSTIKDAAREAWRLAVEYRDQAATLGEPPDIGKKPPQINEEPPAQ